MRKAITHLPKVGFFGVFVAGLSLFLIVPLFIHSDYALLMLQICFSLMILSTIVTLSQNRFVVVGGLVFFVGFLFFDSMSILDGSLIKLVIAHSFHCIFLVFAIILLFRWVIFATEVDTDLVFASITIYLFTGILFARIYFLIDAIVPNSFHGIYLSNMNLGTLKGIYSDQFDLLYYSFTTLATLGLGDITPIHHLSKSLTALEAVYGQLFVATVVAKVVSVWKEKKQKIG